LQTALYGRSFACNAFSGSLLKFYDYPQNFSIRENTKHA
jgi:hypothetical protein